MHDARSNLCRFSTPSRGDTQRHSQQPLGSKAHGSGRSNWKGQNRHLEGRRSHISDKPNRTFEGAFGSTNQGYGNSPHGQKRKLPPHEQKKEDSWLKAKQKLSPAEFQQRMKTSSCIKCGEQGHIFEACTKPKPS